MLFRDDQDLATDQLAAGHENDRTLAAHRTSDAVLPQERAAAHAEPGDPVPSRKRLIDLRDQISRLQLTLSGLPTESLARFDALDAEARDLAADRSDHQQRLDNLTPPVRRLGRVRDPDGEQRALLQTAIELDDRALADLAADRSRLQRELGDPEQVRSERDGITNALDQLQREHRQLRDVLTQRIIDRRPAWLTNALGDQPQASRDRETWDRAARDLTAFRLDHDVVDHKSPLGPEPSDAAQRREWDQAGAALARAQRQLGREPLEQQRGLDLGMG